MIYAHIDNNNIVTGVMEAAGEIAASGYVPLDSFDLSLLGKRYEDGAFVDPEEDLETARRRKLAEVRAHFERRRERLLAETPPLERATWPRQEEERRAYLVDPEAPIALVSALAEERGLTVEDLVERIGRKAEAFRRAIGLLTGKQHLMEDAVERAASVEELEALTLEEPIV